ncbi:MAG TPA: glycosyltransferase family 4 protein [Candidatus Acidoferrales bacterium]|nr:glycosyltransferase family 4 protein [Candidatus Acidoferrales bacterium]
MRTKPIAVLLFTNSTVRAGVEEHILELLRGLDRKNFRLYLACPAELLQKYGDDIPKDVQTAPIMVDHVSDFHGAMQLARMLRRHKIDILHSHQFNASFYASPIGWLCRVPVIIETSHSSEGWRKGWLKSKYIVDRLAEYFVDYYIAVSHACGDFLAKRKRLSASKIRVILNGCNLDKYDPVRPVPSNLRQTLGFGEYDPILVALARLEPQKGHHILLDAMPLVLREFSTARLVCVGDGVLREALEKQTDSLGVREAVRFVGYQSNVPDWLALADFTVLSSYYEGLPLVAIESLAAGRTMVATAVDGTPDVIINGETGLTVPPGDSRRMAEAICTLLGNPALRQTLAQTGRRHVLTSFSSQRFVQDTARLYLDAWDRRLGHAVAPTIEETGQLADRP